MDFAFTEDQDALRELARKILEDRVTHDRLKQIEASADWFDRDTWQELARANLLGVAIGEAHGGSGWGFVELCILLVEVGRAVAPVPVYPSLVLGALPLAKFGTAAQKQRFLPRVAAARAILCRMMRKNGSLNASP